MKYDVIKLGGESAGSIDLADSVFGVEVREDMYALSEMIQWVWRSAIRDGKDIWIYIPSRRMRELFQNWLDSIAHDSKLN